MISVVIPVYNEKDSLTILCDELARVAQLVPLVASKRARQGKATAYVCEKGTCELPTTDPDIFSAQLRKRR